MVKGMAKGMDFSIDAWMEEYQRAVKERFGGRVWFIGLQGSFGRGEATEGSDIDAVLILDTVSAADLQAYGDLLDGLPQRDRVCGFVSGQEELLAWEPSDLFQFYHDTVPLFGSLDELSGRISREDVVQAIHLDACNIYHMTVHNLVHEKSMEILKDLCKSAVFVLQAIAFLQTGIYARKKTELAKLLGLEDRRILDLGREIRGWMQEAEGIDADGKEAEAEIEIEEKREEEAGKWKDWSGLLLEWASAWIKRAQKGKSDEG